MRYNTPIYFQNVEPGPLMDNGDYADGEVIEVKKFADVTESDRQTLLLFFGEIREGHKTIRLRQPYKGVFSRIRLFEDGKDHFYKVDKSMLKNRVFVVHEVQGNG
jgi:hypothetical protein